MALNFRIGEGWDTHQLVAGRPLIHVFSAEDPGDKFQPVAADLEDVFFSRIAGLE